ncbi:hypothetical protein [Mesorhizobium erdmanii]|uniref:hypothetical protein n=1 Tax=Mesorhizobium erdmanii TaxID=1777866 RepID=UPI0012B5BDA5|nr:hypothetical protein [Mesorhizobium erdmanii]
MEVPLYSTTRQCCIRLEFATLTGITDSFQELFLPINDTKLVAGKNKRAFRDAASDGLRRPRDRRWRFAAIRASDSFHAEKDRPWGADQLVEVLPRRQCVRIKPMISFAKSHPT